MGHAYWVTGQRCPESIGHGPIIVTHCLLCSHILQPNAKMFEMSVFIIDIIVVLCLIQF